jgi:hypothetical protein
MLLHFSPVFVRACPFDTLRADSEVLKGSFKRGSVKFSNTINAHTALQKCELSRHTPPLVSSTYTLLTFSMITITLLIHQVLGRYINPHESVI